MDEFGRADDVAMSTSPMMIRKYDFRTGSCAGGQVWGYHPWGDALRRPSPPAEQPGKGRRLAHVKTGAHHCQRLWVARQHIGVEIEREIASGHHCVVQVIEGALQSFVVEKGGQAEKHQADRITAPSGQRTGENGTVDGGDVGGVAVGVEGPGGAGEDQLAQLDVGRIDVGIEHTSLRGDVVDVPLGGDAGSEHEVLLDAEVLKASDGAPQELTQGAELVGAGTEGGFERLGRGDIDGVMVLAAEPVVDHSGRAGRVGQFDSTSARGHEPHFLRAVGGALPSRSSPVGRRSILVTAGLGCRTAISEPHGVAGRRAATDS